MSLIEQLVHQYSTLTASLTANIARIQRSNEGDLKRIINEGKCQIADIDELLEQMELLAPDIEDENDRRKYQNTMNSFKTDAKLLKAELVFL
ncbi:unnamed protein product [Soboliphyme baturini]|uniref:V-SNARE domain-containing protein n=1 Tax=Soboliphyme baturini TaxID=241478 RepID=A0A183ICR6_9BILA|nr:unnamed protein product [Soboliphyme baturini]